MLFYVKERAQQRLKEIHTAIIRERLLSNLHFSYFSLAPEAETHPAVNICYLRRLKVGAS